MITSRLRISAVASLAALTLLTTACGTEEAGKAVAASSSSSAPVATATSAEPTSTSASSSSASSSTASSSTASSSTASPTTSSSSATLDPSAGDGTLDAPTAQWFDTFCSGILPLSTLQDSLGGITGDAAGIAKVATAIGDAGTALTTTAAALSALPPPTIPGGEELASKVVPTFTQLGTTFTTIGTQLATGDMEGLSGLSASMMADNPMSDLSGFKISPETTAAIGKIPSCSTIVR
ncbi:hypothetical protein EH165_15045 [Nakamurella antarctica]|uniref:Lipoprotein n=1 Tax=Nakamurella antarctica TaxID=1902245 RepID=A0A3G8ZQ32_9ACTN|nr:hypothetical protein [Nakamurella antarctica]AZI59258.1 hypothetical protein EH165_15045 [Nakamurella antarctica]